MPRGSKKKNGQVSQPSAEPEAEWVPAHVLARLQVGRKAKPTGRREIDTAAPLDLTHSNARTLKALTAIAHFDPRRLTYDDGTPRPISELDDDTACALMGLEVQEVQGLGVLGLSVGVTKKYRQADRLRALEILAKIPDDTGQRLLGEEDAAKQKDTLKHLNDMARAGLGKVK